MGDHSPFSTLLPFLGCGGTDPVPMFPAEHRWSSAQHPSPACRCAARASAELCLHWVSAELIIWPGFRTSLLLAAACGFSLAWLLSACHLILSALGWPHSLKAHPGHHSFFMEHPRRRSPVPSRPTVHHSSASITLLTHHRAPHHLLHLIFPKSRALQ